MIYPRPCAVQSLQRLSQRLVLMALFLLGRSFVTKTHKRILFIILNGTFCYINIRMNGDKLRTAGQTIH